MLVNKLRLKNFRNFIERDFTFDKNVVVIEGNNGTGKTSILEALYYSCYLKSFRIHNSKNIIQFDADNFFLNIRLEDRFGQNDLQVFFSRSKGKSVKLNKKPIFSHKPIIDIYKVIAIWEEDIFLVGGAPDVRRQFLNQYLILLDSHFITKIREYNKILQHRNAELVSGLKRHTKIWDELAVWSKQLWEKSVEIQKSRISVLVELQDSVNELLNKYFPDESLEIKLSYILKKINLEKDFDSFWSNYEENIFKDEVRWRRSLFGAHLDDFSIKFQNKRARVFASRGQQKLIVFLLKVSQLKKLQTQSEITCLLIDDFLTDLDLQRSKTCIDIISELNSQVIITCPLKSFLISRFTKLNETQLIEL